MGMKMKMMAERGFHCLPQSKEKKRKKEADPMYKKFNCGCRNAPKFLVILNVMEISLGRCFQPLSRFFFSSCAFFIDQGRNMLSS